MNIIMIFVKDINVLVSNNIIHFVKNTMYQLKHHDWTFEFRKGHDSYCFLKSKTIVIGVNYDGDLRQIILHEIAHIDTAKYCNQKHNHEFWKKLEDFCYRFINNQQLDINQQNHKKYISNRYYSIKYKD